MLELDELTESAGASVDSPRSRDVTTLASRIQPGKYGGLVILTTIVVVFAVWIPETFLTTVNLRSILSSQAIVALIAIGLLFPLSAGVFDLSVAQNVGFSALVCAGLMANGPTLPWFWATLLAVGAATLVGVFNGFLVAVVGIDSFIATLGTTSLLAAAVQIVANGEYLGPLPENFSRVATGVELGIPVIVFYVVVVAVLVWYVLEHSPVGRRVYATGANAEAARLSGVRTVRIRFCALIVSGAFAGVAGVLLASTLGTVNQTLGPEYLLPCYAAAFLGSTQLKPGRFNVGGTLLAILLLGTGVQGLQLVGGDIWVTSVFNGAALIIAVGAATVGGRLRQRRSARRAAVVGTAPR